ncbi:hypothetical protein [Ralstonia solanacearum]|uniref:hypothetical protein n=1 Tax=Ralstonia solanacearum TaxID=305 RepID=UPI0012D42D1A|nr:hypothetical protein [Ralstonia solanacearum]MCL9828241.1 hypothetical protein [Ralstonia solanacearum]MCL9832991.1 hypothetical protein [Ralstonia solanacearum]MCL9837772.1 hypothetical protein [Ralstonia solanacearum]
MVVINFLHTKNVWKPCVTEVQPDHQERRAGSPMRCIGGSVKDRGKIAGLRTRVQFRNRESNWQMITGRKLDEVAT